jgi:hypothetical protein
MADKTQFDTAFTTLCSFSCVRQPIKTIMKHLGHHIANSCETRAPVDGVLLDATKVWRDYSRDSLRSSRVWRDESRDSHDSALLVDEAMGWTDADIYFPQMDHKAERNYVFNENSTYIEGEDSVMVKVGRRDFIR